MYLVLMVSNCSVYSQTEIESDKEQTYLAHRCAMIGCL